MQIQHIVAMAPRERQTMLFSATMTEDVEQLVRVSLRRPVRLAADICDTAPEQLVQEIVRLKVCSCKRPA
jgi:ATP-dependent RNA helicase DDX27